MSGQARTFTLAEHQAEFIDKLVESGRYESVEEVVSAGLEAVKSKDERYQEWLRKVATEASDEMKAHPERGMSAEEAFAPARALHAARMAGKA